MSYTMSVPDLASVLFASSLQPSDDPSLDQVRRTVGDRLADGSGGRADYAAYLAQEAGDHPEAYAERMHWALGTVTRAYTTYRLAA
jgi:hypothetical protein